MNLFMSLIFVISMVDILGIFLDRKIEVVLGDITKETTDVIVNAANSSLLGGGGVDGAIHRAGGSQVLEECQKLRKTTYPNGLPTGDAILTSGGKLKPMIIHTVGPVYHESHFPNEELCKSYQTSLRLAITHKFSSISFPAISTGVYGFPKAKAAHVVSQCLTEFFDNLSGESSIEKVRLVFYSKKDMNIFLENCDGFPEFSVQ